MMYLKHSRFLKVSILRNESTVIFGASIINISIRIEVTSNGAVVIPTNAYKIVNASLSTGSFCI